MDERDRTVIRELTSAVKELTAVVREHIVKDPFKDIAEGFAEALMGEDNKMAEQVKTIGIRKDDGTVEEVDVRRRLYWCIRCAGFYRPSGGPCLNCKPEDLDQAVVMGGEYKCHECGKHDATLHRVPFDISMKLKCDDCDPPPKA